MESPAAQGYGLASLHPRYGLGCLLAKSFRSWSLEFGEIARTPSIPPRFVISDSSFVIRHSSFEFPAPRRRWHPGCYLQDRRARITNNTELPDSSASAARPAMVALFFAAQTDGGQDGRPTIYDRAWQTGWYCTPKKTAAVATALHTRFEY